MVETDLAKDDCLSKIDEDTSDDVGVNRKLVVDCCTKGSSCRSGGENEFPSTTTSVSLSELESVTANKLSSPQSEVDTSLEPLVEVPPTNTTRLPSKKCRLIVKFGVNFDRSSTEDIASNTTTVSETMASKVCPVCKTFSSSSNTTLNAHIDQCLSGESTPKWTSDFKLSRHRIKPRKTRLMVDVYSTAKRCTLEELDRRNGTNWATISSLPSQDNEALAAEARKQRVPQVHPEETGDVGTVYIDSSGTKVRILSKLNDALVVSKGDDVEPRKPFKGGNVHKLFSTKKKMKHASKHQKYLKLTPQSKKLRSYNKEHKSQIYGGQERFVATQVDCEKNSKVQNFKSFEHAKPSDRGTLGQWVCSKRTGLVRNGKSKDGHQPLRSELHAARDLMVETDQLNSSDSLVGRSHVQRLAKLSENAGSFAEVSDRMESSSHEAWDSDGQWSPTRKRMRSSLAVPRINRDAERAFSSMKQKTDHSTKGTLSLCEGLTWKPPPSCTVKHASALVSNKAVETCAGSPNDSDTSPHASAKPSRSCYGFPSKATRLSSLRKKVSSLSPSPGTESKFNAIKKSSTCKKSQMHVMAETNKEAVAWSTKVNQQQELLQTCTVNRSGREYVSDDEDSLSKSISTSQREEDMVDVDEVKSADFSDRDSDDSSDEYDSIEFTKNKGQTRGDDTVDADDSTSKVCVGDSLASLGKSLNPEFHKVVNCMKIQSDSLQPVEDTPLCGEETQTCTNEPNFVDGPIMFSGDEAGNGINVQSSHCGAELNCEVEQGNSFLEVDPIPIPGPPGSFLPSPGGDDSSEEDFQGNSSLTTSRFQSSQDQHELVNNRDSSDSPVSATSSISNPTAARFDVNYTEPLSAGSCTVQDKFGSGFFGVDIQPSVENARTEAERFTMDGESLKVSKIPIEKGRLNFRNDDQPCCCSRKERVTQGSALNCEEPQPLRRRNIASMTVSTVGRQMTGNPNSRPDHVDIVRPEMFPLSSCQSSGSEKVLSAVTTSSLGLFPSPGASDVGAKFSGRGDCSPSAASNPILRLMGKNLLVVNKDEDTSTAQGPSASSHAQNNHQSLQCPPFLGTSRNQDYNSFHPFINQGLVNFSQGPLNSVGQPFDVRMSNGFGSHSSFQSTLQAPAGTLFHNQYTGGSFAVYAEPHEYRGERVLPTRHDRPKNRLNGASMYNLENVEATANPRHKNLAAASNTMKEIIMIDDGTETEDVKQVEGSREGNVVPFGSAIAPNHSLSFASSCSRYHQLHDASLLGDSTTQQQQGVHFQATSSARQGNTSPVRWSRISEVPLGGMQQRTLYNGAVPPPTSHLRSTLYYSPRLS